MPVTFSEGLTSDKIFAGAAPEQYETAYKVLQFGLVFLEIKNSFVHTVIDAYNKHHALIIRPDDVWLAILTQFNFFVNANAEALRAAFVSHEGKRKLVITEDGNSETLDFGAMARKMVDLVDENWALPKFTTTTTNDTTVAAVLLMSTLKAYFQYGFSAVACGIPKVTNEGEKDDWEDILGRLEKLKEYGVETIAWYHLLRPVIVRFVKASTIPTERRMSIFGVEWRISTEWEVTELLLWLDQRIHVFSEKGRWLGYRLDLTRNLSIQNQTSPSPPEALDTESFWDTYAPILKRFEDRSDILSFDGSPYHHIDCTSIPRGYTEVDVSFDDNGKNYECAMVAGMIGTLVTSSGDDKLSAQGKDDTVRPVAGWWMFC
ncbi:hypothetical protein R3P38DRAFT_3385198 [Favolaschia claudopus]|uniref:Uncharacterized protein n=1 Tax=Favolaschia claudopus TaxID=2862362 RepID=A0AAW0E1X4_9AGAR